jgi:hypothetical protein
MTGAINSKHNSHRPVDQAHQVKLREIVSPVNTLKHQGR